MKQIAKMLIIGQRERKIASQMHQIGCSHRTRSLLPDFTRELFQALHDIGGNDTLFLDVLGAPTHGFSLTIQLVTLQFHRTCQGNGTPVLTLTIE